MFTLTTLLGILLFFWVFIKIISKKLKFIALEKNYGYYKGLSIFGSFLLLYHIRDVMYTLPKMIRNQGSLSSFFWFFYYPTFYTQNPEFMEQIFLSSNCNAKTDTYSLFNKEVGAGLINLGGTKWERHRRTLNPSFSHQVLMGFFPNFNDKATEFVRELDSVIRKGDVTLHSFIQNFTIKTAFGTLMNIKLQDDDKRSKDLMMHATRFWKILMERVIIIPWKYDLVFRLSKLHKPYTESKQFVMDYMHELIDDRMVSQGTNQHQTSAGDSIDIKKSNRRLIEKAVEANQREILSSDEVYDEILTIFFASFDTSATTLFSTLFFLATHPQYQEKLFEEIASYYPNNVFEVKYEDFKNLVYMDMVINETLRLAPAAPIIARNVTKDMKIVDNLILPKGTTIVLDIFNMQRNEAIWGPNANRFNPDNFLPENLKAKSAHRFAPFAKGGRMCIGWRYADYFLKVALAKIVRNYRFTTKFHFEDVRFFVGNTMDYVIKPSLEVHRR